MRPQATSGSKKSARSLALVSPRLLENFSLALVGVGDKWWGKGMHVLECMSCNANNEGMFARLEIYYPFALTSWLTLSMFTTCIYMIAQHLWRYSLFYIQFHQ